ncbi:glyoxalase-like domain protein [Desertifilum sp. FACHB-1129]|uniref:Glyoxalase-like domain protein n=2 Tax=Desertifilum TaxID=1185872 RepID=A0A1E5QCQ8_9CYAN|nr:MULTISPECIES: glyoxalase-like domain protein [unclassified Desertifilum]MDA0211648.1 glyoxalase-like domain protein [Cyanobacteria bacterium FC1]MDL5045187.1 glyoxalase-like domain protein [Oscillatoria amoena NRMC-F 0135]OEJ72417.1 glyoxalase-like domain protein [Desertifilum tharense IPPAS B-1220]MBD2312155.1 glyoxalase-like domain protein [Desertifilum sp. FACHB-1129]MBD2322183.1 glyoxalase-like domain protein [Desertifilum sp. FACHB-866]
MILIMSPLLTLPMPFTIGAFFPLVPLDSLFSTQGIMVLLLVAYAGAMWMFLTSAPKVHTIMVSDLDVARQFYEGLLNLPVAEVPLHYYYNYEQTLGTTGIDPLYMSAGGMGSLGTKSLDRPDGLWYQLQKNTQLHVISGASLGRKDRQRHVCFDHDCLEQVLMRVQLRAIKHKIRRDKPLNFLVKDLDGRVIEMAEVAD